MIEPIPAVSSTAAIVVVAADELGLMTLVARLERRYGTEYDVIGVGSGADGLELVSVSRAAGRASSSGRQAWWRMPGHGQQGPGE